MNTIQPVHTSRISVALREMTIGQTQQICAIPYQYEQRSVTEFLRAVCTPIARPNGAPTVDDPLMWSVNERMHATIFYMAAVLEDGPDFAIGEEGKLHDYLLSETDYVESVEFEFNDEQLLCTPLHGYQAEVIEELVETGVYPKEYVSWQFGVIAACVRGVDDPVLEYRDPASYRKALIERIDKVKAIPERRFMDMFHAYQVASVRLQHFVYAVFNADGVVAHQVTEPSAETGVPTLGTARFHPYSGVSGGARELLATAAQPAR